MGLSMPVWGPPRLPDKLFIKQLEYILQNRTQVVPTVALALALAVFLGLDTAALVWLALVCISKWACLRTSKLAFSGPLFSQRALRFYHLALVQLMFDGVLWGYIVAARIEPELSVRTLVLLGVGLGVNSTAAVTSAALVRCFVAFAVPQLGLPAIELAASGAAHLQFFALCTGLYAAIQVSHARSVARTVATALKASMVNSELVASMAASAQRERRARQSAERATRERARFLASASHDLRQPIHAQGLFFKPLVSGPLTPMQRRAAEYIEQANLAAAEMLNNILDFSQIEAGVIEPVFQRVALQTVMHQLEAELGPVANAAQLVYRSRDCAAVVHTDPALLKLVLRNLITNAIRYTETGGVLVGVRARGDQVSVEVWDTGVGISPQHQRVVFAEFFQIDQAARKERRGLGLGLAIASRLCEGLGSRLELASRVGRGSVFRFRLPLAPAVDHTRAQVIPLHPPAAPPSPAECLAGRHVLCVEDDPVIAAAMEQLLVSAGCRVTLADTLDTVRRTVRSSPPDLVLSDYHLGEVTGARVLAYVAQALPGCPVALITGDASETVVLPPQLAHVPVLRKPMRADELLAALARLLMRSPAAAAFADNAQLPGRRPAS